MSRTLAVALPPIEAMDGVPIDRVPAILAQLAAYQARLAARLATERVPVQPDTAPPRTDRNDPSGRRLYSVPEAAKVMGLSASTLRRQVAAGALPVVQVGRSTRVTAEALAQFVSAREHVKATWA